MRAPHCGLILAVRPKFRTSWQTQKGDLLILWRNGRRRDYDPSLNVIQYWLRDMCGKTALQRCFPSLVLQGPHRDSLLQPLTHMTAYTQSLLSVPLPMTRRNTHPNDPNTCDFQFKSKNVYSNGAYCFQICPLLLLTQYVHHTAQRSKLCLLQ